MPRILQLFLLLPLAGAPVIAQTVAPGSIQATSTATMSVTPDQVQLTVSVITQSTSAAQAGQQNATQSTAMIAALKQVLGNNGTLQTTGYSLNPNYATAPGQAATITGYTAENTLQVTAYDLTLAGPLIDAARQAGGTNISGLTYGLRDPEPAHLQALSLAGKQAQAHAGAIAAGLGAKAGAVISAVEAGPVSVIPLSGVASASSPTPVVTGTVSVSATVTVTVQLSQ